MKIRHPLLIRAQLRVGLRNADVCIRNASQHGMMVQMASSNTLLQAMVPDRLRGRVMAVYSMMFMGMAPFGALFAGTVAGACVAVGAAAFLAGRPRFRFGADEDRGATDEEPEDGLVVSIAMSAKEALPIQRLAPKSR